MKPGRRLTAPSVLACTALALLPGCATKKYVQEEVGQTEERIRGVETAVEENQRRIRDVDGRVGDVDQKAGRAQATGDQALVKGDEAAASAEEAKRLARGKLILETTLTDDVTQFSVNRWELPDGSVPALDDLANKVLGMDKRIYLEIQGHTDSTGAEDWNFTLGERRANAVLRYLNQKGVPLYAMSVISLGSTQPVADNKARDGRAQNRRVVVRVVE